MINEFLKSLSRKLPSAHREKIILILGSVLFISFVYLMILHNSNIKKKRYEAIDSFLSKIIDNIWDEFKICKERKMWIGSPREIKVFWTDYKRHESIWIADP